MDRNSLYFRQVQLLMRVLPLVAEEECFALKGGTAINLFVRDLPRLSVDIDLVYLPMDERSAALKHIAEAFDRIADRISHSLRNVALQKAYRDQEDALRLIVTQGDTRIKLELSPVLRGTVYPEKLMEVVAAVQADFGYVEIKVVSLPDLYAGKICAALDRQHPRDLFDVKLLLENEGLTGDIRKAFLVYLISHNRTISELLRPTRKDIRGVYEGEFRSMAQIDVPIEDLERVREQLVTQLNTTITSDERQFLVSFKSGRPDWPLLGLDGIEQLPAVRWKQINLDKMSKDKKEAALKALEEVLFPKG